MKSKRFSVVILSMILTVLAVQAQSQTPLDRDKKQLEQLEYQWLQAEFKLDTATISSMMDENFIAIGMTGLSTKKQELAGIHETMVQRKKHNHVVDSLYLDEFSVQRYDNAAIVTFFSVTKGRLQGVPFENRRTRMYDVWIKVNGEWKAVSSQVTPIK